MATRTMIWALATSVVTVVVTSVGTNDVRAQGGTGGTITGHIKLTDASAGNAIIRMGVDPMCSKLYAGKRVFNEVVLRDEKGGLANAFVDVDGKFTAPPPTGVVELDQQNCLYSPRVTGARVGQTLRIVNRDALTHNVHSHSSKGNDFNFTQPTAGLSRDIALKGPDVMMRVGCDIHSWMATFVGVETHPYFAVSSKDGSFKIAGVPAGRYPIRVWHERYGQLTQMVTVTAGKPVDVTFTYTGKEKPSTARLQPFIVPSAVPDVRVTLSLPGAPNPAS